MLDDCCHIFTYIFYSNYCLNNHIFYYNCVLIIMHFHTKPAFLPIFAFLSKAALICGFYMKIRIFSWVRSIKVDSGMKPAS